MEKIYTVMFCQNMTTIYLKYDLTTAEQVRVY